VDSVDKSIKVREIVSCEHLSLVNNPFLSSIPNVGLIAQGLVFVVIEEGKIKLICEPCASKAMFWKGPKGVSQH
jgi:hypothetical protein